MRSTRDRTGRPAVRASAAAAVACCLAATAAAQEPAGSFGERIDVALVNVDVWVSDRQGNPVTGLGAGSFEVLHDGRPVPISHFVEVRGGEVVAETRVTPGAASAGGAPPVPAPPSHLVLYFDQSRLHPTRVKALAQGAEELLAAGGVEPERVLILRQNGGLSVEAPFGSTRQELEAALGRLAKGSAAGMDLEAEARLAQDAIRSAWEQSEDAVGSGIGGIALAPGAAEPGTGGGSPRSLVGGVGSGGGPDACGMFVNQVQPILDSWVRSHAQRVAVTLSNLADAASFLAGLPGVKTLLYLSDGLSLQPGAALATYASDLCPAAGADLLAGALVEEMSDRFLELTRHANTNRVTIHALQATGLRSPGAGSAVAESGVRAGRGQRSRGSFEARKRSGERQGLSLLAGETGGRSVLNRNEFGPEMLKIGEEALSYYSLAYRLPPAGDGASHRIEVKLEDGSLTARYRRGYRRKSAEQWLTERIEGALNLGITDNPLEVSLGAGAARAAADGTLRLPVQVRVPVERLGFVPQGEGWSAEIVVKVLARGMGSDILKVHTQTFRVRGAPGATGSAGLPIELELDAGSYLAAFGVQDRASRAASFVATVLTVRG